MFLSTQPTSPGRWLKASVASAALMVATPSFSQTLIEGDGFAIKMTDEPTREAIYGEELSYKNPEWFYTGIADLTIGRNRSNSASGVLENGTFKTARIAGYANGPLKNGATLTVAVDTHEEELNDLFRNLDEKTPQEMLERLNDPERYYPTYGDDSTFEETAPTIGKFYARLENDHNHVMWGNFKASINGTEYLRNERTLYGAQAAYNGGEDMADGRARHHAEAFFALPGSLVQRDVFLGTGGSSYFLRERDLSVGSETIQIETRDPISGVVIERRILSYGTDYSINYAQGLILLNAPLAGTSSGGAVATNGSSASENYLVATYEYTPVDTTIDGISGGIRYEYALNDRSSFGLSLQRETNGTNEQSAYGFDYEYTHSESAYFKAELARTDGDGLGYALSTDGGLLINDTGATSGDGYALKLQGRATLKDFGIDRGGYISGYFENREAGFSTITTQVSIDELLWGMDGEIALNDRSKLSFEVDSIAQDGGDKTLKASVQAEFDINERTAFAVGVSHLDQTRLAVAAENGSRTNLGARLTYAFDDGHEARVFAEGTIAEDGPLGPLNRFGIGGKYQINRRIRISGEVSDGTGGIGAELLAHYEPNDTDNYYFGYRLDPQRELSGTSLLGDDDGQFVLGGKRKINEQVNVFAENTYDMFGAHRALSSAYGIEFNADKFSTYTAALEIGNVEDDINGDFERLALSLGGAYQNDDGFTLNAKAEIRQERGQNRDADTYLLSFGGSQRLNENERLLARADVVYTDAAGSSVPDARYAEATIGYAMRPFDTPETNFLFKYTYIYDDSGQVANGVSNAGIAQRSHLLSFDMDRVLDEHWTVGGKIAARDSEIDSGSGWTDNNAALGVVTARFSVNEEWDVVTEGRILHNFSQDTTEYGALIGAYRHINENVLVGVGYNFGRVSDDLRDVRQTNRGLFVNLVVKF